MNSSTMFSGASELKGSRLQRTSKHNTTNIPNAELSNRCSLELREFDTPGLQNLGIQRISH